MDDAKGKILFCPRCGKRLPVEVIVQLGGKTVLKVYCKRCHKESLIELNG